MSNPVKGAGSGVRACAMPASLEVAVPGMINGCPGTMKPARSIWFASMNDWDGCAIAQRQTEERFVGLHDV